MEFKRIFIHKKSALILLLAILLTAGLFICEQCSPSDGADYDLLLTKDILKEEIDKYSKLSCSQALKSVSKEKEDTYVLFQLAVFAGIKEENQKLYNSAYREYDENIKESNKSLAQFFESNRELYTESYLNVRYHVLDVLERELLHLNTYKDKLNDLKLQADSISGISIFSEANSFSDKNINKTVEDYSCLENVKLSFGNYEDVTSVINFDLAHYIVVIFLIWLVFLFYSEQKRGLNQLVFATKKGRLSLSLKRTGILFFSAVVANVLIYSVLFTVALYIYGGYESFLCTVQSIPIFADFVIPMSVWQLLLYYLIFSIVSSFAVSEFVWLIVSAADEKHLAITVFSVIFALEYALYYFITPQSNFCVFKYLNLFPIMNLTDIIITYRNFPFLGNAVNARKAVTVFCLIALAVTATLCLIVNTKKRPERFQSKIALFLSRQSQNLRSISSRAVALMTIKGKELYKILIMQKGIIAFLILVYIVISNAPTGTVYYGKVDSIINDFYASFSGEISKQSKEYISNLEAEIESAHTRLINTKSDFNKGIADEEELRIASNKFNSYSDLSQALEIISQRTSYIEGLKENYGIDAWYVNQYGYEKLLGVESYLRQEYNAILSLIAVIIILSGIFSYESKSNTKQLVRSSIHGREKLFNAKLFISQAVTFLIWGIVYGTEFFGIYNKYGLDCFNAPLQSLEIFGGFPIKINIATYLISVYLCRLLILQAVKAVVMLISGRFSYVSSMLMSFAILVIPAFLNMVGLSLFKKISLSIILSVNLNIVQNGFVYCVITTVSAILIGAFCLYRAKNNWCKTV